MGVFDYLTVRCPLPTVFTQLPQDEWQTKSLNCEMREYVITEDGELLCTRHPCCQPEDPEYNLEYPIHVDFTGDITFYTSVTSTTCHTYWFEFVATVVKGRVLRIVDSSPHGPTAC